MKNLLYLVGLVAIVAIAIAVMRNDDADVVVPDVDITEEEMSEESMDDDMVEEDEPVADDSDMDSETETEAEASL